MASAHDGGFTGPAASPRNPLMASWRLDFLIGAIVNVDDAEEALADIERLSPWPPPAPMRRIPKKMSPGRVVAPGTGTSVLLGVVDELVPEGPLGPVEPPLLEGLVALPLLEGPVELPLLEGPVVVDAVTEDLVLSIAEEFILTLKDPETLTETETVSEGPVVLAVVLEEPVTLTVSDEPVELTLSDGPVELAVSEGPEELAVIEESVTLAVSEGALEESDGPVVLALSEELVALAVSEGLVNVTVSEESVTLAVSEGPALLVLLPGSEEVALFVLEVPEGPAELELAVSEGSVELVLAVSEGPVELVVAVSEGPAELVLAVSEGPALVVVLEVPEGPTLLALEEVSEALPELLVLVSDWDAEESETVIVAEEEVDADALEDVLLALLLVEAAIRGKMR